MDKIPSLVLNSSFSDSGMGHAPKGVWVTERLPAGGELCVSRPVLISSKPIPMKIYPLTFLATAALLFGAGCTTTQDNTLINTNQAAANISQPETKKELDLAVIMQNVQNTFPTVQEVKVFTEANDPYNNLGKPGYYTAGAAFWDTRTKYSEEYTTADQKGKWGASAGGSIEIYASDEDAKKRVDYMQAFTGNPLTEPGAFKQIGSAVIRASKDLSKSQQDEIMAYLETKINNN